MLLHHSHLSLFTISIATLFLASGCDDQASIGAERAGPSLDALPPDSGGLHGRQDQGSELAIDLGPLGGHMELGMVDLGEPDLAPPEPWAPVSDVDGELWVRVTLDGAPLPGALITQGGSGRAWRADDEGTSYVQLDLEALDELTLFASHESARTRAVKLTETQREPVEIKLQSADPVDELGYSFSDPGEPTRRESTSQCGHCHLSNNDAWYESPHRRSAKNPTVYDLYMGRASGLTSEEDCLARGGRWALAQQEGRDEEAWQCFQELSALGAFNERCTTPPCDTRALATEDTPEQWGGCADCHAPAINGVSAGGQDLLSARGHAFDYGVSCDLCHHVDEINWSAPAGVGGRLSLWRPGDEGPFTLGASGYLPLSFGPSADVSNPRMGISPRAHFRSGELCGGCHQHNHEDRHARDPLDEGRWPQGALPNQSTYAEWREGPVSEVATCNSCHMPPLSGVMNSANLERFVNADVGIQAGWPRPHGEARQHSWWGPRQPEAGMLRLAAGLSLTLSRVSIEERAELLGASPERLSALASQGGQLWQVHATSENLGAGHGLPTGEPMRHLILSVDLHCPEGEATLVGGDVVQGVGGSREVRPWAPLSELRFTDVRAGDLLRVTRPSARALNYAGYGAFGSLGTPGGERLPEGAQWVGRLLEPDERGLYQERAVGELLVTAVSAAGALSLTDRQGTPVEEVWGREGDQVWLQRPSDEVGEGFAGGAGFSFARVMINREGQEMVPHFVATDVTRDNRLAPGQPWRSEHLFSATCESPVAVGYLIYRPYPLWLARERGWTLTDEVIVTSVQEAQPPPPSVNPSPSYPEPSTTTERISVTLSEPESWSSDSLRALLSARGQRPEEEEAGGALTLSPLPTLWSSPHQAISLTLSQPEEVTERALFTQAAWAQGRPSPPLQPGEEALITLAPRRYGVASYEVKRGENLWRGALVSLPASLRGLTHIYQLSLGRAEARAATRRAQPWPWRLERGELSARALITDIGAEGPLVSELDLSAPQVIINQSSLPILLDVPRGVEAWGGAQAPTALEGPSPRSPQRSPHHPLALLLPPGEGALLWASGLTTVEGSLYTLGMSEHGGRSWDAGLELAMISHHEAPTDELLAALELEVAPEASANEQLSAVRSELISLLGEPVDLEGESSLSRFMSLPPYTLAGERHSRAQSLKVSGARAPSARWVYQGDRRAGVWRLSGGDKRPQRHEETLEIRNLSAQGQSFSVEGHLHQLITERGARSAPRAVSWIPIRGRALVVWPAGDQRGWRAGALYTPEAQEGLSSPRSP